MTHLRYDELIQSVLLTLSVAAGLRKRMTVSQHGRMGHCDAHGASLLAGFILLVEKNMSNLIQKKTKKKY